MNRSLLILFIAVATVASLFVVAKSRLTREPSQEQNATEQTATTHEPSVRVEALVNRENTPPMLEIAVSPELESVDLGTFALKMTVQGHGEGPIFIMPPTLTVNPDLARDGWTFPIAAATRDEDGNVDINLSGALIAKTPLRLSQRLVLARLPLTPGVTEASLTAKYDPELTTFMFHGNQKLSIRDNVVVTETEITSPRY